MKRYNFEIKTLQGLIFRTRTEIIPYSDMHIIDTTNPKFLLRFICAIDKKERIIYIDPEPYLEEEIK